MSLFSNKKPNRSTYQPTETAQVNESTEVDLFVADNGTYWGLSRVNPNGGRSYRLLKPEQCRDAAEAVGFMAKVFAQDINCAPDLKAELSELSQRLESAVAEVKELAAPNGQTKRSGLLAAHGS